MTRSNKPKSYADFLADRGRISSAQRFKKGNENLDPQLPPWIEVPGGANVQKAEDIKVANNA